MCFIWDHREVIVIPKIDFSLLNNRSIINYLGFPLGWVFLIADLLKLFGDNPRVQLWMELLLVVAQFNVKCPLRPTMNEETVEWWSWRAIVIEQQFEGGPAATGRKEMLLRRSSRRKFKYTFHDLCNSVTDENKWLTDSRIDSRRSMNKFCFCFIAWIVS